MIYKHLTKGYSHALLSLATEEKKISKYKESSKVIVEALDGNEKFIFLLDSKALKFEKREKIIRKAFKGIPSTLMKFLLLVTKKSKAYLIKPVLKELVKLINKQLKIKEGIIYSIDKLKPSEIKEIEKKIGSKFNIKPELTNKIDKELLSGIKVVMGDQVIEDTISSRLNEIKGMLLRGGN